MAHSPESVADIDNRHPYAAGWDALGALIARGHSFSGRERNVVLLNTRGPAGEPRFADASGALRLNQPDDSRCVIPIDWDGDGDLDLWYANRSAPRLRYFQNNLPAPAQWIALRPVGRRANRDAIGLRVDLHLQSPDGKIRRIWRSLRAGDSFLSQTPKVIVFPFRAEETIVKIDFRWPPPARVQSLATLAPNAVYQIVESDGPHPDAQPWQPEAHPRMPQDEQAPLPAPPNVERARLLDRLPVPEVDFYSLDGKKHRLRHYVDQSRANAVLVLAQASWCPICRREMSRLGTGADRFQAAGLQILSLAVDGAHATATREDVQTARQFLVDVGWPFDSGMAPETALRGLAAANARALYPEQDLPLPSAWMIDREGRIAVIYRGPVAIDDILADARTINTAVGDPDWAFPFPGRLAQPHFRPHASGLAQAWLRAGEPARARDELIAALSSMPANPSAAQTTAKLELMALLAETEWAAGDLDAAAVAVQSALGMLPDAHSARRPLAQRLWTIGSRDQATDELNRLTTAATAARNLPLLSELARTWRELAEPARALDVLAAAEAAGLSDPRLRFERALARQATGDLAGAIADNESLVAAGVPEAGFNLAWILSTCRNPHQRQPARALALTESIPIDASATLLDTRAAALAANGRYPEAVDAARRALAHARAHGDAATATEIIRHLAKWELAEPWLE